VKAVIYALIASLSYGIATPIVKIAFNKGMHPDGYALSYAIGLLIFVVATSTQQGFSVLFPSQSVFWIGIVAGMLCAVGFKTMATALAIPTSLIAIVTILVATYPIISSAISLTWMKEASQVQLTKLIIGTIMVISGGLLVTTSIR